MSIEFTKITTLPFLLLQMIQTMAFVPLMVTKTVPPKMQNYLKVSVKKFDDLKFNYQKETRYSMFWLIR